ncbi:MAG TPA: glycoside hydrolase family 127 protein [Fimbriimonadaceae bacterium]|nr:six-hairpin glycosidase [Armatimonadota bacterium]HRD30088.1 glycoside hydrolase family 127 protein [Fimbriimonadaceae bacterium]HRE94376.1 glycoside hydrolase family 127 protein [Fimbriimonadaceae bacterium]
MTPLILALIVSTEAPKDYPVQPIPFNQVHLTDKFWAPRIETNRVVTIPYAFEQCEQTGRMDLFVRAAKVLRGEPLEDKSPPGYPFDDSDVYKVMEGAAYALSVKPDPELEKYVDDLIALIASAQEPDGYLYCTRTINPESPHPWAGKERWVLEQDNSHELYNLGHMYEAAAAHYQATGKRTFLDIATKSADLLVETFLKPGRKIWPGHQVIEIGLGKLYRITGKKEYLELSKLFLDSRGGSGDYWQAHKPVIEQTEAVGHAVRATYMYSGMADVAALRGEDDYLKTLNTIWEDVVQSKLYITGGIGSTGAGEAFGKPYELPNMTAYCETCAQIGNVYWNQRLFLLHGDAKYVDVLERTLYNGLISGVALDGKTFFYPNPLESIGQHARSPWFGCACCPSNVTRFMASTPGYFYAHRGDSLYVNLFASGHAEIDMGAGRQVKVAQETNYPWDGEISLKIDPARTGRFKVMVRIPGWARNEAVPSKLYAFKGATTRPTLRVNGRDVAIQLQDGYAVLDREWKAGDTVSLSLPMPVRRVVSSEKVVMNQGRVAIQRGPIVYCAEGVDNANSVRTFMLPDDAELKVVKQPDLLGGVVTLQTTAMDLALQADGSVKQAAKPVTLIPYYSWANRGRSEMLVWLPNRLDAARPAPLPTIATKAQITASGGVNPNAINDGSSPAYMGDSSNIFFHWWPKKGTEEWVEMKFAEAATVSEAVLYWFDDTGVGECRVPESWRLLYKDGDQWKPVADVAKYGVAKDQPNLIKFAPVRTTALRLEVKLQNNWSSGIWEWSVK